jgi:hypothetical protein
MADILNHPHHPEEPNGQIINNGAVELFRTAITEVYDRTTTK